MPTPIRLLLADDHTLLRQGTIELLRDEPDLEIVGEAKDGLEAVELAHRLHPDIVVMDVRMPGLSGMDATRQIRDALPEVRVLALTAHDDAQYVFSLFQAGASGYLLKTVPAEELIKAIHRVYAGESHLLDPAVAGKFMLRLGDNPGPPAPGNKTASASNLTARELDVMRLVAQGLSNRAIAEALEISDRTVQVHLSKIFAKLHVASRVEAILLGIRQGWLTLET